MTLANAASIRLHTRVTGIGAAVSLGLMLLAVYVLPHPAGVLVGALALIGVVASGAQFVFQGATLISLALEGQQRQQFQVAISLAAPVLIALLLASRVDAVPLETLGSILTPWLLIPLGIIAWIGLASGSHLNREHPFRGFLIAAAILGVLCWFWTAGMGSDSDYDGEGSSLYLDPERARRARETGEYVWRFLLYVITAYLALFLKWRRVSPHDEALRKVNEALTPEAVDAITSKMGGYVADRKGQPGPEADLPFPRPVIELAFLKAMRDCSDPKKLEALKVIYFTLDSYMLTDEEYVSVTRFRDLLAQAVPGRLDPGDTKSMKALLDEWTSPEIRTAQEINKRLTTAMDQRLEMAIKVIKKSE